MRIWVAALICALPLGAQQTGGISGRVDDITGAAVSQARVSATSADKASVETYTDAAGNFVIADLPAGRYKLQILVPGFMIATRNADIRSGGIMQEGEITLQIGQGADPVELTCGDPVTPHVAFAPGKESITGWVMNAYPGTEIEGAAVILRDAQGRETANARSRNGGRFIINQPPGHYSLTIHTSGHADFVLDSIEVRAGMTSQLVEPLQAPLCPDGGPCNPVKVTRAPPCFY
jgi:hypothetical protein